MNKIDDYNIKKVRDNFPILNKSLNGNKLVYLDTAASAQKPSSVIKSIQHCYENSYANIHRGLYDLSENLTEEYENVRILVKEFINASSNKEIIFLRGATEAINLVASSWGYKNLKKGDNIILTTLEHHSNIVPWQLACQMTGAEIKILPIDHDGNLRLDELDKILSEKTKLLCITQASNAIGTITPINEIIKKVHAHGALVLVDGCQGIAHLKTDVKSMDCDFYVFSGHKIYGPSGVGVLYGKESILESMPPYQSGGEMIDKVSFENTTYAPLPHKFEAGTPSIVDTIGMGEAIKYINSLGYPSIKLYESKLIKYAKDRLSKVKGLRIIGKPFKQTSLISFVMDNFHSYDIGSILNAKGIAVRVGHHCTQPLMDFYQVSGTVRASFGIYNTLDEIDLLYESLQDISKMV